MKLIFAPNIQLDSPYFFKCSLLGIYPAIITFMKSSEKPKTIAVEVKDYLRENLTTTDTSKVINHVVLIVKGWINYYAVSDTDRRVTEFIEENKRTLLKWFNRRGSKHYMTWNKLALILKRYKYPNNQTTGKQSLCFNVRERPGEPGLSGAYCLNWARWVLRGTGDNGAMVEILWHRREIRRKQRIRSST